MIVSNPHACPKFKGKTICSQLIGFFTFGETGGAMVEMALVMPVMLCLITGIFSVSMALYQKLQLAEAMSSAGRVLAADRGATDPCADTVAAVDAAAPGLATSSIGLSDASPIGAKSFCRS